MAQDFWNWDPGSYIIIKASVIIMLNCSERDLMNLIEFYLSGFIGLQCSNRHDSEVSICGNEGKLMAHPSSPLSDENYCVLNLE
jgi:hypothetical protein